MTPDAPNSNAERWRRMPLNKVAEEAIGGMGKPGDWASTRGEG
jgi:hypothetical protein